MGFSAGLWEQDRNAAEFSQQRATSLAFSNLLRCLDSFRNIVRLGGTERLNTSSGSFAFCTEQKSPRKLHVNCNGHSNQRWYWFLAVI